MGILLIVAGALGVAINIALRQGRLSIAKALLATAFLVTATILVLLLDQLTRA